MEINAITAQEIEPLGSRILVCREEVPEGMIIIPDIAREKSVVVKVVKAGPGRRIDGERVPLDVKPGDVGIIGKWIDYESGDYAFCDEADIRVIINERRA